VKFIRSITALLLALALCGCENQTAPTPPANQLVQAVASGEPTHAQDRLPTIKLWVGPAQITAEIASTAEQIRAGMMFRTNMPDTEGMLFVFRQPHQAGFWMKNCPLPLSCAYVDAQGVIRELHDMEPHNTNSITASTDQVMFVLETSRGWFERNGIRTNMVIETERGSLLQTFFK